MTTQTSQKWNKVKLSDLGSVDRGRSRHRPRNDASLYGGIYPFVQTGDIKSANFYIDSYSQTYNEKGLAQSKLWNPNTLCITIAANIGESAILKIPACFPDSVVGFQSYENVSDVRYVKYLLDLIKNQFQAISQGTTQDNLSLEKLLSINFDAPEYLTQKQIADALYVYDNLIANNSRRIKILEEIAQKIYNEWFVNFRFPGHKKAKPEKSGLFVGWSQIQLDDCATLYRGKSYSSTDLVENEKSIPFINLKCIKRFGGFRKGGLKLFSGAYKESHVVRKGDIVMAVTDMTQERMIVARSARIPSLGADFGVISMDLVKIEPKENCVKDFLYAYLRWSDFSDNVKNHANGANVLHLTPDRVTDFNLTLPSLAVQKQFSGIVSGLFAEIDGLELTCENLSKTRDLLIPQLVTGKLEIKP